MKEDETPAEKNMALLKSLFDDMDRDKNSLLDITEFSTLILATWETFNRSPPNQQALIDRACTRWPLTPEPASPNPTLQHNLPDNPTATPTPLPLYPYCYP